MERIIDALEEHAGEVKEDLETEAAVLQHKVNQALEYGEESRVYSLRRGEARRQIEDLEETYNEARAIAALGEQLDIIQPEENREEEVRLAKEKWFESPISNPYTGSIGEAMQDHIQRQQEAKNQELLTHTTPVMELKKVLNSYEILLYEIGENIEGLDPDTPFEPQEYDSEIITYTPEENPDEPVDLSEYLVS